MEKNTARLEKYYQPIEMPESVKDQEREGVALILSVLLLTVLGIILSMERKGRNDVLSELIFNRSDIPGQYVVEMPEFSQGVSLIVAAIAVMILLFIVALYLGGSLDRPFYMLLILVGMIAVILSTTDLFPPSELDASFEVVKSELSEESGLDLTSHSYNHNNGILSLSDGVNSYDFLVTEGNKDGNNLVFITAK